MAEGGVRRSSLFMLEVTVVNNFINVRVYPFKYLTVVMYVVDRLVITGLTDRRWSLRQIQSLYRRLGIKMQMITLSPSLCRSISVYLYLRRRGRHRGIAK